MSTQNLVKIEGEVSYKKDTRTGAILNTDIARYKSYKAQRERCKNVDDLSERVDDMDDTIKEIKSMLSEVLQSLNK